MEKIKLNLGCFDKKMPGFINVDIREEVQPDVVDDAFKLEKFEPNSVDLIYCCHMFEHLDYKKASQALSRWRSVLKEGGMLRLAVPDMEAVFAHYFYWGDLTKLRSALSGSQRHEFDYHLSHWDYATLAKELYNHGFSKIKRYDPLERDPHSYIDDYSHAYYPDGSKPMKLGNGQIIDNGGKPMSLNIEAT